MIKFTESCVAMCLEKNGKTLSMFTTTCDLEIANWEENLIP